MEVFSDLLAAASIIPEFDKKDLLSPNEPSNQAMDEAAGLALPSPSKPLSETYLNIMGNSLLKFDRIIGTSDIEQAPVQSLLDCGASRTFISQLYLDRVPVRPAL